MLNRVHVIDPDIRRRASISRELSSYGRHVEIYKDVQEFLAMFPTDGLILAADGSDTEGQSLKVIQSAGTGLPVIAYAENPSIEHVVKVVLGGVGGYLTWPFDNGDLVKALNSMFNTNSQRVRRERILAQARDQVEALTRREREVLIALVGGLSNKEIGRALRISPRTVEIHRSKMMMKLGAHSAADVIRIGLYAGLDEACMPLHKAA